MNIRWRLLIAGLQLASIAIVTKVVTGSYLSSEIWFVAVLALSLNSQLLEPFFARPSDTLVNSLVALVLVGVAPHRIAGSAWLAVGVYLVAVGLLAVTTLLLGAGKRESAGSRIAGTARALGGGATAQIIYSAVFWLALLEYSGSPTKEFWSLSLAWVAPVTIAAINWAGVFTVATGARSQAVVEGMIGPSLLAISCPKSAPLGGTVSLEAGTTKVNAVVVSRVVRSDDTRLELHVGDQEAFEQLAKASAVTLKRAPEPATDLLGVVDAPSDHLSVVFSPTRRLSIGQVIAVPDQATHVLYQITQARVHELTVKGAAQLRVRAVGKQLGIFDVAARRLRAHLWVPEPGGPVVLAPRFGAGAVAPPQGSFLLGHVIGTDVPVYLDLDALSGGHMAILGMTRMGKSTLAVRLARALAASRSVLVMDQTGEYRSQMKLDIYDDAKHSGTPSLSVFEPSPGKSVPDEGLAQLKLTGFLRDSSEGSLVPHLARAVYCWRPFLVVVLHPVRPGPSGCVSRHGRPRIPLLWRFPKGRRHPLA